MLAYSTVSQLGFMFIGVGVGAFSAGFFHVFTHAFFKACLFLGAGSVIHAMHARIHDTDKSQDMRNMGGLAQYLPITRWTFLLSCFAIAGAPPLAGFWSKDEILWKAFSSTIKTPGGAVSRAPMWAWSSWLGPTIYWLGIVAATMTAFYMFRAYFSTFHGKFKGWTIKPGWKDPHAHGHDDHGHHAEEEGPIEGPVPHESPLAMTVPLMVLAAFAVFAGFLNAEPIHSAPLGHALEPLFEGAKGTVLEREASKSLEWAMMVPGVLAFLAGSGAAMVVYLQRSGEPERACLAWRIAADDRRLLQSPLGLHGRAVLATLWWGGGSAGESSRLEAALEQARGAAQAAGVDVLAGASLLHPQLLVWRGLAHRVEPLMQCLRVLRGQWRQSLWELPALEL